MAALLTGCDVVQEIVRGSAPEHAYAQSVPMDTAGVVTRRISAELPGDLGTELRLSLDRFSMLPDGHSGVVSDWTTGELVLYDLQTGTARPLTDDAKLWESGGSYSTRISPDGRTVAYTWENFENDSFPLELRLLEISGGEPRVLYSVDGVGSWIEPHAWAPDGRSLVVVESADGAVRIVLVPIDGGEPRIVRTLAWRWPGPVEFSPDGRFLVYDVSPDLEHESGDIYLVDLRTNREHPIVSSPADDRLLGWVPGSDKLLFTSDRTGTTGAWTQRVSDGRAVGSPVLVRPDFWRASPRGFSKDGRFLYTVQTSGRKVWAATVDPTTGEMGTTEPLLPEPAAGGRREAPVFSWSSDGRAIAVAWRRSLDHAPTLIVRSVTTAETREYRLPSRFNRSAEQRWSRDDGAIFLRMRVVGGPANAWVLLRVDLSTGRSEVFDIPVKDREVFNGFETLPDGRSVLLRRQIPPATPEEPNIARLTIRDLETGSERDVFDVRGSGLVFAVSPDGSRVAAFGSPQGTRAELFVIPLDGSAEPRRMGEVPFIPRGGHFFWDSSGTALLQLSPTSIGANASTSYQLDRFPLDGSARTTTRVMFPEHAESPTGLVMMSPRSDRLAFVSGDTSYELWALEGLSVPSSGTPSGR
ncbi:MAG: hypothetical protein WEG36_11805 [Gemmatimonadota bacterium]